jgi:hydroxypyruvate isomerase
MNRSNRRDALKKIAAGTAAAAVAPFISSFGTKESISKDLQLKGNVNHSVCQWTYNYISLEELCIEVKKIGIGAIDLIAPKDWPILKKHGLHCSMCYIAGKVSLTEGWNNKTFHPQLIKDFNETIPLVKEAGYTNLICFSGNRKGMDNETGMNNCAEGLKQIMGLAEKNGVIIQMELLNSKINHKDYMCDRTPW